MSPVLSSASTRNPRAFYFGLFLELQTIPFFERSYVHTVFLVFALITVHNQLLNYEMSHSTTLTTVASAATMPSVLQVNINSSILSSVFFL